MESKTKRSLSNRHGFPILAGQYRFVLIAILLLVDCGVGVGYAAEPVFSIKAINEPLNVVLEAVSKSTGYRIGITRSWESNTVSVELKKTPLDDGLKRIIRSMGDPNNAIIRNEKTKRIEIRIFDNNPGSRPQNSMRPPSAGMGRGTSDRRLVDIDERNQPVEREAQRRSEMDLEAQKNMMEIEAQRTMAEIEAQAQRERHPEIDKFPRH